MRGGARCGLADGAARLRPQPDFGIASLLVGGADADADQIIDATLIDIKVSAKWPPKRDWWHQAIGYAALTALEGIDIAPDDARDRMGLGVIGKQTGAITLTRCITASLALPTTHAAIYHARYGQLLHVPLAALVPARSLSDIGWWLISAATRLSKIRRASLQAMRDNPTDHGQALTLTHAQFRNRLGELADLLPPLAAIQLPLPLGIDDNDADADSDRADSG